MVPFSKYDNSTHIRVRQFVSAKGIGLANTGEKKQDDIVIVGAGAAGLSAALYLKKQGYKNVTVLEKLGRVGGLCKTITRDYVNFDLGANYITPAFREVLKIAREFGMEMYGERNGKALAFDEKGKPVWKDIWREVRGDLSSWKFLLKCGKYAWLRYKLQSVINKPGFAGISEREDLCVSFGQWLEDNELECLQTIFECPITIMGYGYIKCPPNAKYPKNKDPFAQDKEVPAPHALKYMSFWTFVTLVAKLTPVLRWVRWPKRFVLGYQRFWEVIAFNLNVETRVDIESIHRNVDGKIRVKYRRLQQHNTHTDPSPVYTHDFDKLIVACPLEGELIETFLKDMTADEKDLLGHVISYTYKMTSCHVENLGLEEPIVAALPIPEIDTPWAITQQYDHSDFTQFYSRERSNTINFPEALRLKRQEYADTIKPRFDVTKYDAPPKATQDEHGPGRVQDHFKKEIDQPVLDFVEKLGGTLGKNDWHTFDLWPYFQHYRVEEIKEGYYDRFEALQGVSNTYYVGGLMNFELVNHIMEYSKHIVGTHFPEIRD